MTSDSQQRKILFIAGEASGDAHGAELLHALHRLDPQLRFIGTGGPRMAAVGQEQLFDLTNFAVVGLVEVAKHYWTFRRFFHQLLDLARREKPEAVVLIDYPGFNLRFAAKIRRQLPNTKIIYYISPQVWAWKAGRVFAMQRDLDLLLSIFPFEKTWYVRHAPGLKVEFVGHPLMDRLSLDEAIEEQPNRIALLPGSREAEIRKHLPVLWKAARLMAESRKDLEFIWLAPDEERQTVGLEVLKGLPPANFKFEKYIAYPLSHLRRCVLALVASGTASLECGCIGVPQIVVYKVNPITYFLGRHVVKVKYLSMVNVLADSLVVPEFIQKNMNPSALAQEAQRLLDHPRLRQEMKTKMAAVMATLGQRGASQRAAEAILKSLA